LGTLPGEGRARGDSARPKRLPTIEGKPPNLAALPAGCKFRDRCAYAEERCAESEPALFPLGAAGADVGRSSRCFFHERVGQP
jgi:oligopeptide/dipeptide ABC transporter ATP-binding protein